MAKIATCPQCAKQLGLPATIAITDRVECPECGAVFALRETVQIALPVARVLDACEPPLAAASSPMTELLSERPLRLAESDSKTLDGLPASPESGLPAPLKSGSTAPLRSWEERLKKALAKGSSDNLAVSGNDSASTLDAHATSYDMAERDQNCETVELSATQKGADTFRGISETTVVDELGKKVELSPEVDAAADERVEVVVPRSPRGRSAGRALPKIAALAVGPVAGSLLGLYGLLWLQGAKADYLGLARVLPASMLPSGLPPGQLSEMGGASEDSSLAESLLAADRREQEKNSALAADRELTAKSQGSSSPMKRDPSVLPASAAGPLTPMRGIASTSSAGGAIAGGLIAGGSTARVKSDQFSALVDEAAAALPEFFVGDLSTPDSVRRKGQAYMAFCRLAEHFDFAQQPGLTPAVEVKARQARQLYRSATGRANYRQELSHIASRWWGYPQRPNSGIFLAGQVEETQPTRTGALCWVKLSDYSVAEAIPVLLKHRGLVIGDQVGVVGSVISSPSELLAGWDANVKKIVVAQYDYPLDADQ